jgi:uncharacterized membrane protein
MGKFTSWLFGLGLGAGLMYFLDPQQGNRRKAMVRDRFVRLQNQGDDALQVATRDLRNRVTGILADAMTMVSDENIPDPVLEERVRSRMGFLARHPGAVDVSVDQGQVMLSGDMLSNEVDDFVRGLSRVRGIRGVQNNLRVHQEAGNIPQLQGEGWLPGDSQMQWSPSTRLLAGLGGTYLMVYGMGRGGLIGLLARLGGIAMGTRALANRPVRQLAGRGGEGMDTGAVRVNKSINIDAPVEEVYGLWSNFENFPRFMNNIEAIRSTGGDRSHWVVKGPAGSKVEFDAITTENIPNEVIAWETTPDSQVKTSGQVRFKENHQGRTQVNVNMAYTPPAGVAGHAVAKLFGKDPKSEMDEDLQRMKSLLETGKTRSSGKRINREEVLPVTGGTQENENLGMERRDQDFNVQSGMPYQGGIEGGNEDLGGSRMGGVEEDESEDRF